MRALVTGATGFIGSNLVAELRRRGWSVVCVVRRPVRWEDPGITCVRGDLLEASSLSFTEAQVGKPDVLFHIAAHMPADPSGTDTWRYMVANTLGTMHLVQWATKLGIRCVVYASSLAVVGKPEVLPVTEAHPVRPSSPYHMSKLCGELYCEIVGRSEGRQIISLRITSPYGRGMPPVGVLPGFVRRAVGSEDLFWFGSGRRAQNFVHVSDVVRACILAPECPTGGVYNVGGETSISMRELAEVVVRLTPGSRSVARPSGHPDPQDDYCWDVDLRCSEQGLGYRPAIPLEEGLAEYIKSVQSGEIVKWWWSPPCG